MLLCPGTKERATASDKSCQDDRRYRKDHLSDRLLCVPHIFLHPPEGSLVDRRIIVHCMDHRKIFRHLSENNEAVNKKMYRSNFFEEEKCADRIDQKREDDYEQKRDIIILCIVINKKKQLIPRDVCYRKIVNSTGTLDCNNSEKIKELSKVDWKKKKCFDACKDMLSLVKGLNFTRIISKLREKREKWILGVISYIFCKEGLRMNEKRTSKIHQKDCFGCCLRVGNFSEQYLIREVTRNNDLNYRHFRNTRRIYESNIHGAFSENAGDFSTAR